MPQVRMFPTQLWEQSYWQVKTLARFRQGLKAVLPTCTSKLDVRRAKKAHLHWLARLHEGLWRVPIGTHTTMAKILQSNSTYLKIIKKRWNVNYGFVGFDVFATLQTQNLGWNLGSLGNMLFNLLVRDLRFWGVKTNSAINAAFLAGAFVFWNNTCLELLTASGCFPRIVDPIWLFFCGRPMQTTTGAFLAGTFSFAEMARPWILGIHSKDFQFRRKWRQVTRRRLHEVSGRNVWYGPIWWKQSSWYQVLDIRCVRDHGWGGMLSKVSEPTTDFDLCAWT